MEPEIRGTIERVLSTLCRGEVVELRIPKAGSGGTVSGYFNDYTAAANEVEKWNGAVPGIYFTLNPLRSTVKDRVTNELAPHTRRTTADDDIDKRVWLPIDIDPIRKSGTSSSEDEHTAAREKASEIARWLGSWGWPEPIIADSGNGAHLLFRIDLPNDSASLQLCKNVLEAIAIQFDDNSSTVDQTVCNAARIWKLYGTMSCKGESTVERPHRFASILEMPEEIGIVTPALLSDLAVPAAPEPVRNSPLKIGSTLDVNQWLANHEIKVLKYAPWKDGHKWILQVCPFNAEHNDRAAVVIQLGNGAISFKCHHNGCLGKAWRDLRLLKEPNYQQSERTYTDITVQSDWPILTLPSNQRPAVAPFDEDLLPDAFRGYIVDVAERLQCPPDFSAAAAMTFAGAVIGRQVGIRPKRQDDWLAIPNLWGAAIGRPGVMKTPAIALVQHFVSRLEIEAKETYLQQKIEHDQHQEISALESKKIRDEAKEIMKKGGREDVARKLSEIPSEAKAPIRPRYIVNDTTVEKLGELLADNPRGLILVRDELVGFLKGLEKNGNETQRAFMLEAWNGDGRFTYDRIIRETVEIEAACVSIFGGIQPGPFAEYLRSAIDAGSGDDGLIQRFQLIVWPDVSTEWRNVDRWPNTTAKERMWQAFRALSVLGGQIGEREQAEPHGIPFLRFSGEAQELFNAWREVLELEIRSSNHHPAFESHLSKYRSLIPSLALICHLVDSQAGPVGAKSLARALAWGEYLRSHANRVYSTGLKPGNAAALDLVNHITRRDLPNPFSAREVYRNEWKGLKNFEQVDSAIVILEAYGCLRTVHNTDTGGRHSTRYFIHPELLRGKA
jgi:hypothetical protein